MYRNETDCMYMMKREREGRNVWARMMCLSHKYGLCKRRQSLPQGPPPSSTGCPCLCSCPKPIVHDTHDHTCRCRYFSCSSALSMDSV